MRYVRLGRSGLEVSAIALGTSEFGGDWGAVDAARAKRVIHGALDAGITLFDTAVSYGFGLAEEVLGRALWQQTARDQVVIATKGGLRREGAGLARDAGAASLRAQLEASLRSLGTDYVDLYQIHWPDPGTPPAETATALEAFMREGKVRHVGVSNYDVAQIEALARHGRLETVQPPYHLFRREIEADLLPYCLAHDLGVLAYQSLAGGLLGGKLTPASSFPAGDWRHDHPDFGGERFRRNLEVVRRLQAFAGERDIALPQLAVAWVLAHPAVQVAIVGARDPARLAQTAAAAHVELSLDDLRRLDVILAPAAPITGQTPEDA